VGDLSPVELVFARLLGLRGRLADAVEAECEKNPEIADELREKFAHYSENPPGSAKRNSRGLARRLVDRYSDELGESLTSVRPPPSEPLLPKLEGRYDLKNELARGGMGAILRTWDTVLSRELAMKVVLGHADGDVPPERLRRFLREARVTAQLAHPGIVPVHELGSDADGHFFFTMRLVEGRDLRSILRLVQKNQDGWNLTRALNVLLRVCEALSYAHSKDVVHRDIKPANVMVGAFGEVYLMDWGLAKLLGEENDPEAVQDRAPSQPTSSGSADHSLTLEGAVVGTPSYMAPEQAKGIESAISPLTDVYAMGAILYQLLSGAAPFREKDRARAPASILEALREGPPADLQTLVGDGLEELVAICNKAMNREPERRHSSMESFSGAIRGYLEAEQEAVEAARRARREAARAERVAEYLGGLFRSHGGGSASLLRTSAWTVLDAGAEELMSGFEDQPLTRATLLASLSEILLDVDASNRAISLLEEELSLRQNNPSWPLPEHVVTLRKLARAHEELRSLSKAESVLEEALTLLGDDPESQEMRWQVLEQFASLLRVRGDLQRSSEILIDLTSAYEEEGKDGQLCEVFHQLGQVMALRGNSREANRTFERAKALCISAPDVETARLSRIQKSRAMACLLSGEDGKSLQKAEDLLRSAISNSIENLGVDHHWSGILQRDLAGCLVRRGVIAEAEELARQALVTLRRCYLPTHPEVGATFMILAVILLADDRTREARRLIGEAESLVDLSVLNGKLRAQALETGAILRALCGDHLGAAFIIGELNSNVDESEGVQVQRKLNLLCLCRDAGIVDIDDHYR